MPRRASHLLLPSVASASPVILILFLTFIRVALSLSSTALGQHVTHFELLNYDAAEVERAHARHVRSAPEDGHIVSLDFVSHGRRFRLDLERDNEALSDKLEVGESSGVELDTSHIYHGKVRGDPTGYCYGSIRDGVFDGQIESRGGTYYVERVNKFLADDRLQDPTDANLPGHSVIYHEDHLLPHNYSPGCGLTNETTSWMEAIQRSGNSNASPSHNFSEKSNISRGKRATARENLITKSCSLYIQTDPFLWEFIRNQEKDDEKARMEITSLISQHVKAINRIYSETKFDNVKNGQLVLQFDVERLKIHDYGPGDRRCLDPLCAPNLDVSHFLNLHSKTSHDDFCLAYVFTHREFLEGTVGLAWVAGSPGSRQAGGICEKYASFQEGKKSLNTGIITFKNYGQRILPRVSQITFAHEIGHNLGSPHDPEDCSPGGLDGNYIMYPSATSGYRNNNQKFSPCSLASMSAALNHVPDLFSECLKDNGGSFCGNKMVEEGEECDCGFDDDDCDDQCCSPRRSDRPCSLRPRAKCSPSQGPCCTSDCQIVSESERLECKAGQDCTYGSICNGDDATCPDPGLEEQLWKRDNATCNNGTQVCQEGECQGSLCLRYNLRPCSLSSNVTRDRRALCELTCENDNATCLNIKDFVGDDDVPNNGYLMPGSPCDNYRGYCDAFHKCRQVDAEGPLVRLKNLIFDERALTSAREWLTANWWAVLLAGVGLVVLTALFLRCFAIHTPSSNPHLPRNIAVYETLRRPVRTANRTLRRRDQRPPGGQHRAVGGQQGHTRQQQRPRPPGGQRRSVGQGGQSPPPTYEESVALTHFT